jgi:hypothetical protein
MHNNIGETKRVYLRLRLTVVLHHHRQRVQNDAGHDEHVKFGVDNEQEHTLAKGVVWHLLLHLWRDGVEKLLHVRPLLLLLRLERRALELVLHPIELVDYHTHEQVHREKRADDQERVDVQRHVRVRLGRYTGPASKHRDHYRETRARTATSERSGAAGDKVGHNERKVVIPGACVSLRADMS